MGGPHRDVATLALGAWVPRLLAAWRATRPTLVRHPPPDRLLPAELDRVAAAVRRLSLGLTRKRRLAGEDYLDHPDLLGAYLLYFWPVSYVQARHALAALPRAPATVVDLGSGPGPLALAALDAGAQAVTLADRSAPALALAETLARTAGYAVTTRLWDATAPEPWLGPDHVVDLVCAGHLLNELWVQEPDRVERRAALCGGMLGHLKPDGALLVVEPALRETSRDLLAVRDHLVAAGHPVLAPCLFRGPCPAHARPQDWCHAERPWQPPPLLSQVIAASGLHKEAVKTTALLVGHAGAAWPNPPAGRVFRVVSEPIRGHARARLMVCGPEGRLPLSLHDRERSDLNAPFLRAARGEVLALEGAQPSQGGEGLRVVAQTTVTIVERTSSPGRSPGARNP